MEQKGALISPRAYPAESSWQWSAREALDAASRAWLHTDGVGSEVVRQILLRAYEQLYISIDDARSDSRFEEKHQTAHGSGLPFDQAYYTPAYMLALRSKLTATDLMTCLTSIIGHERISNWIPT